MINKSLNIILDAEKLRRLCKQEGTDNSELALARRTDRFLNETFENLNQQGSLPARLTGSYKDKPVEMIIGTGILGRYSGPETNHKEISGAGMVSLKVRGESLDLEGLEQEARGYFASV